MKQFYSLFYVLFFSCVINTAILAQTPDWSWAEQVSGETDDINPYDMAVDHYGSIYVAGAFYAKQTFGQTILTPGYSGGENPFLIKYDPLGNIKSAVKPEQIMTKVGGCSIYAVTVDENSNAYVTGYYNNSALVFGLDTLNNSGGSDGFIAKYDAGGNALWALNISNTGKDIIVDHDGNIYCAGEFGNGSATIEYLNNGVKQTTTLTYSGSTSSDIFLLKYSAEGDLIWAKAYGGLTSSDEVNCMAIDSYNHVIIGGEWEKGSIKLGSYTFSNSGKNDGYVFSVDENGNVLWANSIGGATYDKITSVIAADNIYVTGYVNDTVTVGSYTLLSKGGADIVLAKYNQTGDVVWANLYGGTLSDVPARLSMEGDEDVFLTGSFKADIYIDSTLLINANYGLTDILLAKFDSSGNSVWAISAGSSKTEFGIALVTDSNNNLYFSGYFFGDSLILGTDTIIRDGSSGGSVMFVAALVDFSDTVNIVDTSHVYELDNGGLYSGTSFDLTYSSTTNRLFSGIATPASLFISDDGATSWYQAFDNDSLEYTHNGIDRGWSGNATHVLANQNNWLAVQTNHPDNKYSSIVISTSNGDTNTWKTVVDPYLLNSWGYGSQQASAIALSDYNLFAALGPCIVKTNSGTINSSTDVSNILTSLTSLASTSTINSIAISNNASGYPYYVAIDELGNSEGYNRLLYKYDGSNYNQITLPVALSGIRSVFTHPTQVTGDTIFISGYDNVNAVFKVYRSFNAGNSWTDISYSSATRFLSDVDYSPNWNLSSSNDLILIIPGNAISKDLGSSWEVMSDTSFQANAINPTTINTVVGSSKAIETSTSGVTGSFSRTKNYGLEALQVNKIARTESETIFYIATKTGIGYSSAYLDTSISVGEKWSSPHGAFPLISDTINFGAVAIDPTDSLHVIAACKYGFYVTTTGSNGFAAVLPINFHSDNPQVKDILILNTSVAIAVTGGDSAYDEGKGNIWRTTDGGATWTNVSPFNFESGNTIAMGKNATDTVIYIGSGLLNVDMGYLWKSTDKGITWDQIKNGPTSMAGTTILGMPINDIAVDPRGTDTLYIASGYDNEYAFVVSLDGGENLIYLNAHAEKPYTSVAINRTYPDTVYTASGREIYLYDLANNNFRFVYRGLPDEKIPDLMTGSILVGTTTGFYTFDPALVTDTVTNTKTLTTIVDNFMVNVFPNPFTNEATISLSLTENNHVSIELYDLSGRMLSTVYNGKANKGNSRFTILANKLAAGSYLVYVKVNDSSSRHLLYHIK